MNRHASRALAEPTSAAVATAVLHGTVEAATMPGLPTGCLGVQGALATGDDSRPVRNALIAWREDGIAHLTRRFQQAVDAGDLPPSTDPHLLALYLRTVANGIAVQAASGSSRPELLQVANLALGSWPKQWSASQPGIYARTSVFRGSREAGVTGATGGGTAGAAVVGGSEGARDADASTGAGETARARAEGSGGGKGDGTLGVARSQLPMINCSSSRACRRHPGSRPCRVGAPAGQQS
jgi:hypothetical protein